MAKSSKQDSGSRKSKKNGEKPSPRRHQDGTRETVESIVVAFILAFLFRTFEAEAFVIPTGSMAPTLYGRHIDFECSQCGTHSVVGASNELEKETDYYVPPERIVRATCPNCRYENVIYNPQTNDWGLPPFKGDRILVNKFPYEFREPKRWEVVVFKYPEDPKTNYIKRLVGLPGEEIKIERGDVYVRKDAGQEFRILRKQDPDKQRRLQILVYDNDRPAPALKEWGWPERWAALQKRDEAGWSDDPQGWQADDQERSFQIDLTGRDADRYRWVRYRHVVPTPQDWAAWEDGEPLSRVPKPTLITDFASYNAYLQRNGRTSGDDDVYWVSDLTINLNVEVRKAEGELLLELMKGVLRFRCRIDLKTGKARLGYVQDWPNADTVEMATAQTGMSETGNFHVSFANVDRRLCLWIDDDLIEFDKTTEYEVFGPPDPGPQADDLVPVGIAARRASLSISQLVIQRDIYYRAEKLVNGPDQVKHEFGDSERERRQLREHLDDPGRWHDVYQQNHHVARFEKLGPDEFFMMGDNSAHSSDSRLWPNNRGAEHRHAVPRNLLVGKAFYIYWPHGVPFLNEGRGYAVSAAPVKWLFYHKVGPGTYPEELNPPRKPYPKFTIPFYPHVGRMHRIR